MLVSRIIVPIVYQPDVTAMGGGSSGMGDINPTFFVAPANPGKLIWGLGPAFLLDTATQRTVGTGKWSRALRRSSWRSREPGLWARWPATSGRLPARRTARTSTSCRCSTSSTTTSPRPSTSRARRSSFTANWKAPEGERWTVPFGAGVGMIFKVGKQPMNGQLSAYYNAIKPDTAPPPTGPSGSSSPSRSRRRRAARRVHARGVAGRPLGLRRLPRAHAPPRLVEDPLVVPLAAAARASSRRAAAKSGSYCRYTRR